MIAADALGRVDPEHAEDQVPLQLVQVAPARERAQALMYLLLRSSHLFYYISWRCPVKWEKAQRHHKEYDSGGPNVRPVAHLWHDGLLAVGKQNLGRHVVERSADPLRHLADVLDVQGEAEVDQVQGVHILRLKQKVLKLDVSMHYFTVVQVDKRSDEAANDGVGVLLYQGQAVPLAVLQKVPARQVL